MARSPAPNERRSGCWMSGITKIRSGNEAIALGAIDAGIGVAAAYPGTPSTEVMESLTSWAGSEIHLQWSANEKVALEVALAAAGTGVRALTAMKQVGLNVALDALMTGAYLGVKGALVLVVADDPGPHSSQTEQDTRFLAKAAGVPVLDPATPQQAYDFTRLAFQVSERFGIPVIVRPTTRLSHGLGPVRRGEPIPGTTPSFTKDGRLVIMPAVATKRHGWLRETLQELSGFLATTDLWERWGTGNLGFVTSGVADLYLREALESLGVNARVLRLGAVHPLPEEPVAAFLAEGGEVYAIEEPDSFLEERLLLLKGQRDLAVKIRGRLSGDLPGTGELSPTILRQVVARAAGQTLSPVREPDTAYPRPPVLCAGCPHRSVFYAFQRAARGKRVVFTGDIGCYTLGVTMPVPAIDTCLCMGGAIGMANGLAPLLTDTKVVAFLGDSTFFHAGIPGLINAVHESYNLTLVILDNDTTAMTGFQPHPGMARKAREKTARRVDIADLCRSLGAEVSQVDPRDFQALWAEARRLLTAKPAGPRVLVAQAPCVQKEPGQVRYQVTEACDGCSLCVREAGCPAITWRNDRAFIDESCTGCHLCAAICPTDAIGVLSHGN